jgi:hypothetical protein
MPEGIVSTPKPIPHRGVTDPDPAAIEALPPANRPRPATSRARRVEELRRGNPNGWHHGTFAIVGNAPDMQAEHALILAAHPALDRVVDHRLVEDLALARVQRNRAVIALEDDPRSSVLTSYASRLMALVERLDRAVRERERERVTDFRSRPVVDLAHYRDPQPEEDR